MLEYKYPCYPYPNVLFYRKAEKNVKHSRILLQLFIFIPEQKTEKKIVLVVKLTD